MPFDPLFRRTASGLAVRAEISQGALVGGIRLPRYGDGSYHGFLVTARCDLAHVRTDTVNLLPVVPLAEWLMFDGCVNTLLSRILALEARLDEIVAGLPHSLGELIRTDWLAGYSLFVESHPDVPQDVKNKYKSTVEEYAELKSILDSSTESPSAIRSAIEASPRFAQLVKREHQKKVEALLANKILDAHFLPVVRSHEVLAKGSGYVILFRQVLAVSGRFLIHLQNGIRSHQDLPEQLRQESEACLVCPSEVVANVTSPHVEHVLQRFANVFGRVGVTDCSQQYREWLVNKTCEALSA